MVTAAKPGQLHSVTKEKSKKRPFQRENEKIWQVDKPKGRTHQRKGHLVPLLLRRYLRLRLHAPGSLSIETD
jgi:hypothetical protein